MASVPVLPRPVLPLRLPGREGVGGDSDFRFPPLIDLRLPVLIARAAEGGCSSLLLPVVFPQVGVRLWEQPQIVPKGAQNLGSVRHLHGAGVPPSPAANWGNWECWEPTALPGPGGYPDPHEAAQRMTPACQASSSAPVPSGCPRREAVTPQPPSSGSGLHIRARTEVTAHPHSSGEKKPTK